MRENRIVVPFPMGLRKRQLVQRSYNKNQNNLFHNQFFYLQWAMVFIEEMLGFPELGIRCGVIGVSWDNLLLITKSLLEGYLVPLGVHED